LTKKRGKPSGLNVLTAEDGEAIAIGVETRWRFKTRLREPSGRSDRYRFPGAISTLLDPPVRDSSRRVAIDRHDEG